MGPCYFFSYDPSAHDFEPEGQLCYDKMVPPPPPLPPFVGGRGGRRPRESRVVRPGTSPNPTFWSPPSPFDRFVFWVVAFVLTLQQFPYKKAVIGLFWVNNHLFGTFATIFGKDETDPLGKDNGSPPACLFWLKFFPNLCPCPETG